MGLLDSILGGALGQSGQGEHFGQGGSNPGAAALLQLAMQLLAGGNAPQGGGGLLALIQQFQQAGMGQHVNSWVGTGQNMPISPDQLMQVFGRGQMEQMASSTGLPVEQVSSGLSDLLPQLIDRVTPQGQVPDEGLGGALDELSRMLPR